MPFKMHKIIFFFREKKVRFPIPKIFIPLTSPETHIFYLARAAKLTYGSNQPAVLDLHRLWRSGDGGGGGGVRIHGHVLTMVDHGLTMIL